MESSKPDSGRKRLQKQYFRVIIIYSDDGTSGRIFSNRDKAEKYAARQKKSPVVKKDENRTVHERPLRVAQLANESTGQTVH